MTNSKPLDYATLIISPLIKFTYNKNIKQRYTYLLGLDVVDQSIEQSYSAEGRELESPQSQSK